MWILIKVSINVGVILNQLNIKYKCRYFDQGFNRNNFIY